MLHYYEPGEPACSGARLYTRGRGTAALSKHLQPAASLGSSVSAATVPYVRRYNGEYTAKETGEEKAKRRVASVRSLQLDALFYCRAAPVSLRLRVGVRP